jgi:DNA-directed RNA polymerase subunit RPC12/RpoP
MTVVLDAARPRCPYCQSTELIWLAESAAMPVDDVRCPGCGSRFTVERLSAQDATQEDLSIPVGA